MGTRAKGYFEELVQTGSRKKKKMTDGIHLNPSLSENSFKTPYFRFGSFASKYNLL
jgi:hypothetical protein